MKGDVDYKEFANFFPDSCQWLKAMSLHFGTSSVKELMRKTGYSNSGQPIEQFTMHLCFNGQELLFHVVSCLQALWPTHCRRPRHVKQSVDTEVNRQCQTNCSTRHKLSKRQHHVNKQIDTSVGQHVSNKLPDTSVAASNIMSHNLFDTVVSSSICLCSSVCE